MDENTATGSGSRAGRREWIGLAVLALPTLLMTLDAGSLFLAVPHLSAELEAGGVQQLWIMDVYGFMVAGFLITMGSLGDRIGRRRLLLIGAAGFGVASMAAAYSTSPEMLIVTRALLGIAGATLMPSTLALITNMFRDPGQRGTAIALWATCQFASAALGPVLGGLLLERFWWGSVFLLGVPVMVTLLVTGPVLLPEHRNADAGRLDLAGVALSLAAILPIIYGTKQLTLGDAESPTAAIMAIVAGAACGVVFVRRQLRSADPLLDLRLFSERSFGVVLITLALAGTGMLVSQYLQTVLGLSPARAALWYAPMGLAVALGSLLAPAIGRRMRPGAAIAAGLAFSVLGFVPITQVDSTGGLVAVVLGIAVIALGTGPLFALGTGLVVGSVPPERAGSAASMSETGNYFGGTLGLAVLGTVGAAVYRHRMADAVPSGVPAGAARTARETLAGATATAGHLPPGPAAELLHTAREAFTAGLNTAAAIGAVLFIGLAVLTATAFRRKGATGETTDTDQTVGPSDAAVGGNALQPVRD